MSNSSKSDLTYEIAMDLILRKLFGEPIDDALLKVALATYPQIERRLLESLTPSPPVPLWARAGLSKMAELQKREKAD